MLNKAVYIRQLWRYFGPRWLFYRLGYAARLRTGLMRYQLPATQWPDQPLTQFLSDPALSDPKNYLHYRAHEAPAFFFNPADQKEFQPHFAQWENADVSPISRAEALANGELQYFSHKKTQVGFPPNWHHNPLTHQAAPANQHWSQIGDFHFGDVKMIWEPSRFTFVYDLVRAYWRTSDERYAELFWHLVEDWRQHNPPQQGPNWKCGQETTFRVMAWCFGFYGFLTAKATTAQRVTDLGQMIALSGQRIEANLNYALSQQNNHGVSEGVGLWTIGTLFPEFRPAEKWRQLGQQILEKLGQDLIYDDGSFVQHSVNYHRLMLHDYLWVLRLDTLTKNQFSSVLKTRVAQASDFLYQIQDETSGCVPNYGQNDGALILPLNNCDYQDFRPIVQAIHYLNTKTHCYEAGPWNEDLLWLFGSQALTVPLAPPLRSDLRAGEGGYYTLRTPTSFIFTRCATFRHRPGQADMLHLDLWWRGQNIARDAGTYSYNAAQPWDNALARTLYHNTVTVDGLDQMNRVGKFMWLPWLQSQVRYTEATPSNTLSYWEGEHNGYHRLPHPVQHRRGILRLGAESWLVVDTLKSAAPHLYRLHWLLPDGPHQWQEKTGQVTLQTPAGLYHLHRICYPSAENHSLVRADKSTPRGWQSPYYYHREPALSVAMTVQAKTALFCTLFNPEPATMDQDKNNLQITTPSWQANIDWQSQEHLPILSNVVINGLYQETLTIK